MSYYYRNDNIIKMNGRINTNLHSSQSCCSGELINTFWLIRVQNWAALWRKRRTFPLNKHSQHVFLVLKNKRETWWRSSASCSCLRTTFCWFTLNVSWIMESSKWLLFYQNYLDLIQSGGGVKIFITLSPSVTFFF